MLKKDKVQNLGIILIKKFSVSDLKSNGAGNDPAPSLACGNSQHSPGSMWGPWRTCPGEVFGAGSHPRLGHGPTLGKEFWKSGILGRNGNLCLLLLGCTTAHSHLPGPSGNVPGPVEDTDMDPSLSPGNVSDNLAHPKIPNEKGKNTTVVFYPFPGFGKARENSHGGSVIPESAGMESGMGFTKSSSNSPIISLIFDLSLESLKFPFPPGNNP